MINTTNMTTIQNKFYDAQHDLRSPFGSEKAVFLLVKSFFAQFQLLIGNPTYSTLPSKIIVQVPYFMPKGSLAESKINALGLAITRLVNKVHLLNTSIIPSERT